MARPRKAMPGERKPPPAWEVEHLGLSAGQAALALVTGDPHRASGFARSLGAEPIADRRGFACYLARGRHPLLLVATGIGGPAMAIVAEELVILGVRAIVRLGTCGALQPHVEPDHLVVSSGCVRDEGTTRAYVDPAFPAVADPHLTTLLADI